MRIERDKRMTMRQTKETAIPAAKGEPDFRETRREKLITPLIGTRQSRSISDFLKSIARPSKTYVCIKRKCIQIERFIHGRLDCRESCFRRSGLPIRQSSLERPNWRGEQIPTSTSVVGEGNPDFHKDKHDGEWIAAIASLPNRIQYEFQVPVHSSRIRRM